MSAKKSIAIASWRVAGPKFTEHVFYVILQTLVLFLFFPRGLSSTPYRLLLPPKSILRNHDVAGSVLPGRVPQQRW